MSDTVTVNLIGSKEEKDVFMEAVFDAIESRFQGVAANTEPILRFTKIDGEATLIFDKIILECAQTSILFDDIELELTKEAFSAQIDTELSKNDSFKVGSCHHTSEGTFLELIKR
jgi:hypothetical protein